MGGSTISNDSVVFIEMLVVVFGVDDSAVVGISVVVAVDVSMTVLARGALTRTRQDRTDWSG